MNQYENFMNVKIKELTEKINSGKSTGDELESLSIERNSLLIKESPIFNKELAVFDANQLELAPMPILGLKSFESLGFAILYNLTAGLTYGIDDYIIPRVKCLLRHGSNYYLNNETVDFASFTLSKKYTGDFISMIRRTFIEEVKENLPLFGFSKENISSCLPLGVIKNGCFLDVYFVIDLISMVQDNKYPGGWVKSVKLKEIYAGDEDVLEYYLENRDKYPIPVLESAHGFSTSEAQSKIIDLLSESLLDDKDEIIKNFTTGKWKIEEE